jgi:hypothetical protein
VRLAFDHAFAALRIDLDGVKAKHVDELRHRPSQVGQLLGVALDLIAQECKQRLLHRENEGRGFRGRVALQST